MANQTDKFNTTTFIINNAPPVTNWLNPTAIITDGDGKVLAAPTFNTATNQATYTRTLTSADIGQQNLSIKYSGSPNYAGGGIDNYVTHIGSSTVAQVNSVLQIVAGPGIYISPDNGQGTVTISLEPIRPPDPNENFYSVTWTISDLANPNLTDQSMFLITGSLGSTGVAVRSRDAENFVDINGYNASPVALSDGLSVQSATFPGSGLVYWSSADLVSGGNYVGETYIWGIEGRTDNFPSNNTVWTTDALYTPGASYQVGGNAITGYSNAKQVCFYSTGSIADALFLNLGQSGVGSATATSACILKYNAFPNGLTNTTDPIPATIEYSASNAKFTQAASNLADQSFASFRAAVVDTNNKQILYSNRTNNNASTWTIATTTLTSPNGVAYGNGGWVAVGTYDSVFTSTDGISWTPGVTGWPGSTWNQVCYGNGKFIAIGDLGRIAFSTDNGMTWTKADSQTTSTLRSIAYSPKFKTFCAVGDNRTIISYKDQ